MSDWKCCIFVQCHRILWITYALKCDLRRHLCILASENDALKEIIKQEMLAIVEEIEPNGAILDSMFASGMFDMGQRNELELPPTTQKRARELLKYILGSGSPTICIEFVKALEHGYRWTAQRLREKSLPIVAGPVFSGRYYLRILHIRQVCNFQHWNNG